MIRPILIAAAWLCLAGGAAAADYVEIDVDELLIRMPLLFEQAVSVHGDMESWGEVGALASPTGRDLMVDLRPLAQDIHGQIDANCLDDRRCPITVRGTIRHIRGTDISELGLQADSAELQ